MPDHVTGRRGLVWLFPWISTDAVFARIERRWWWLSCRGGVDGIYRFTAPPGSALMWAQSRARLQREGLRCTFSSSLPSLKFCCIENLFIFPFKVEMLWRRGGLEEESVHNKCPFGWVTSRALQYNNALAEKCDNTGPESLSEGDNGH